MACTEQQIKDQETLLNEYMGKDITLTEISPENKEKLLYFKNNINATRWSFDPGVDNCTQLRDFMVGHYPLSDQFAVSCFCDEEERKEFWDIISVII